MGWEDNTENDYPGLPGRLLHQAIQPSCQSMLTVPSLRSRGDCLHDRVSGMQAMQRESCDREVSPKDSCQSKRCHKMCELSGTSSCIKYEVPQAEGGERTIAVSPVTLPRPKSSL